VIPQVAVCGVTDFQGKPLLANYSDSYRSFDKLLSKLLSPTEFDPSILENIDTHELRQHRIFTLIMWRRVEDVEGVERNGDT